MPDNRVNASDDVIGALSDRVADLSKRANDLQADLEAAQKRLAVYEEFDATIQEAISGALRAAYQIRERAEGTANQILEQTREERRLLLKEVERLRDERDALMEEIARERRGGIAAVTPRSAAAPEQVAPSNLELRAIATEAVRSMFKDIVAEIARTTQPSPPAAAAAPREEPPAPAARVESPTREEPVAEESTAGLPVDSAPSPEPETTGTPLFAEPASAPPAETPSATEPVSAWPTPPPAVPPPLFEVPRPAAEPSATVEDTEIAPQREEPGTAMAEIQLVLSPVTSFARLVDIERRIQSLANIRSLYVRDFRGGVATLAVGLRSATTLDQIADLLATLGQPALRPVSASRNILELRLEGDASIA